MSHNDYQLFIDPVDCKVCNEDIAAQLPAAHYYPYGAMLTASMAQHNLFWNQLERETKEKLFIWDHLEACEGSVITQWVYDPYVIPKYKLIFCWKCFVWKIIEEFDV